MKKTLVALGPFKSIYPQVERTRFDAPEGALVPEQQVYLENSRIYRIYRVDFLDYYVVYETDNVDFFVPYLARIPAKATDLESLTIYTCETCGSPNIKFVDYEEGIVYCPQCKKKTTYKIVTVWTRKELPANQEIVQGEGIYVPQGVAGNKQIVYKVIAEGVEKLGNIEAKYIDFIGYYEGFTGFAIYRRYSVLDRELTMKIRGLTEQELLEMLETADGINLKYSICYYLNFKPETCRKLKDELESKKTETKRETKTQQIEKIAKEFEGIPIELIHSNGIVEARLKQYVDKETFNKYVIICRKLGFKFDSRTKTWKLYKQ
ncbi:MAG: hypothetical protein QXT64_07695 [Desulfurococcaceae archaeon]